jgi:uncharacterized protein YecE (DUF72 family)
MAENRTYHIGCQSWGYDDWITPAGGSTVFYPRGTKRDEMLPLYSKLLDTIEVDSTLYGVPAPKTIETWYAETPPEFIFSLKFPREVTHDDPMSPRTYPVVDEFVAVASALREKLGIMLLQFPASFESTKENGQLLRDFLNILPKEFRFAFEFRHPGWFVDWTFEELENAGVSLALVEGKWVDREIMLASIGKVASDFAYIRVMGERDLPKFDRIYRPQDDVIDQWTGALDELPASDIFIYVDNYFEGHAPATVAKFKERLGLPVSSPDELETQGSLF